MSSSVQKPNEVAGCTGQCMAAAQRIFESASEAAIPPPQSQNHSDVSKRFEFLNDVAATDPHKEAEILLEHALALNELVYGQEHPAMAEIMLRLAAVYALHGKKDSADYMTKWSREILDRPKEEPTHEFFHLFGMDRPDGSSPTS